ncbi:MULTISPECIES: CPBP family intramembrane glutamic endopeptidase [Paraclostridium]|uniref:CPBP family intramembrane metalloprotease n=3 Tax=Paraclostridium TaxID=1849822 RepID=A0AA44IH42_PARBF|nr:CPBP family intramembrane glutamic endopeptidase [Paraclostridium bifermentans]MBZ6004957.1 CPBP family intramembrane metalloprotease [Paraclostridium bifermentans]MCR1875076.1 CPBP family intramembrane metalloprotease [Paraclostridium bifermentans]MDV8116130.1 CPBP family intramembrane glutamic endopeptidase [Bacillus sp. BAU-SS-2023]NME09429.1 CPBP family intramembrane metalloprotease [Paraclostridium bifermentans]
MNTNLISLIIGICDVLIIFICLKISKKIFPGKNKEFNESKSKFLFKKSMVSCICMILGFVLVKSVIISNWILYLHIVPSKNVFNTYMQNATIINTIVISIQVIIIGPIIEELIFRKILLGKLLEKFSNRPIKAIVYSALIFGIIHLNIIQGVAAFGGGIILGLIYYYTKSIKATIFAHILNNFLIIIPNPIGLWMNVIYLIVGFYLIKKGNDKLKLCTC